MLEGLNAIKEDFTHNNEHLEELDLKIISGIFKYYFSTEICLL